MRVESRAWRSSWTLGVCLLLMLQGGFAQRAPAASTADETRRILIEKAHALEARGRPDMAIQLWQQILLSDPRSSESLAGLARDYKLIGSTDQSNAALERLRAVNPDDPNIGKIVALTSTRMQADRLSQAGDLARKGKTEEAMRVYRQLYGDRPPDGDIALAYYQTLYGAANGKESAVAGMRALAQRNPGDTRFVVELGVMLTYDAKTRAEGIRILEAHPKESNAQTALRQALIWDSANPASAAELRQYLKDHPQDTELSGRLKENEFKLEQMNSGIARTPAERAAFAALNARKLTEAEARFTSILEQEPNNARASAGMGFLRMQQSNFGGAVSYLTQAEQNGFKERAVEDALTTSRFWYTMGEASQAFDENQLEVAAARYKAALAIRPASPEALNGLAGLMMKQQQYSAAAAAYEQLLKSKPGSADTWRGLFLSYARDGQNQKALALFGRFPAAVKTALARDPEYLRTLATIYRAENRSADAQRVLAQALSLPFPDNGTNLKADTRLQYAGILMEARRFAQAVELYTQMLSDDAGYLPAWMGLVSAHHELGQDKQCIADVEKMPPATYDAALGDAGFLSMLGAIYQQANQFDIAQGLLERSARMQIAAGGQPSMALQLQLAGIYLQRNNTAQAYAIYREVLQSHPDRVDAWKGLMASLQATNRNAEALQELALIPPAVRKELETDHEFVQGEASLYAATGDTAHAIEYMNRVQAHYRDSKTQPPANIEVQNAWLLFNTNNDRLLYPALMRLGSRQDLTAPQREAIQTIWANWSVRRAGAAMDNGNLQRAGDILDAASQAFPDSMAVRKAVAGGYVKVGRARESLALYKTIPMQDATAADFQGAIGAALAANDKVQAEIWLRQALDRFQQNAAILSLAARFEQARGDNQRAADYWRASLAAMPQSSPADRLAHELAYPEQDSKAHRAVTAADLQHLLDPNYEPFQKTTKLPPLPAYGADPYNGRAPVDLNQPQPAPEQKQWIGSPSSGDATVPQPQAANSVGGKSPGDASSAVNAGNGDRQPSLEKPARAASTKGKSFPQSNYMGAMHLPATAGQLGSKTTLAPASQGEAVSDAPIYIPQAARPAPPTQPVFVQQNAMQTVVLRPVVSQSQQNNPAPKRQENGTPPGYSGTVKLPPSEENIDSTDSDPANPTVRKATPETVRTPQQAPATRKVNPSAGLRITSQPMGDLAARAQALFAEQTDSQLTQGSAVNFHAAGGPSLKPAATLTTGSANATQYSMTQYTPSAQEAATGAYSAPKQQSPAPQSTQAAPAPAPSQADAQPAPATATRKTRKSKRAATNSTLPVPTLGNAASPATTQQADVTAEPAPSQTPATNAGLTDEELQQRNLPPLRGPWVRVQREQRTTSPRDEAEMQLRSIESGYSPWLGGTGILNYRTGALGYDHLAALESPFEASMPLGYGGRLTVIARPVFLDSGQADGTSVITVLGATSPGAPLTLTTIPQPIGTLITTDTTPPAQQNAVGIGGEVQLAFPHLAIAGGYTPAGFLVSTFTGRAQWRPGNGPFTFLFSRDSVKDTQLSYAGLRDPAGNTLGNAGQIWGGIVANQGNVQFARGDEQSGFYLGAGGQFLAGYKVHSNTRIDGSGGAYWRLKTIPEFGNLSIGANFFGMHYARNQDAFTLGMGGYFSPQAYFLANAPFTWTGHYLTNWHYTILGSMGVQAFQIEKTALYPGSAITGYIPSKTSVGPNYDLRGQVAYQISPHWFAGGFLSGNNSRNYSSLSTGFFIRFLFRPQPSTAAGPTGLFPTDGLRPFTVP